MSTSRAYGNTLEEVAGTEKYLTEEAYVTLDRRRTLGRENIARLKAFKAAPPPPPLSPPQSDYKPVPLTVSLLDQPAPEISRVL